MSEGATCTVLEKEETATVHTVDASARRGTWFDLFLISLASLFIEMLVIRWLAEEIRLFSYFKNITLISCFLGLGLGSILARNRRDYIKVFVPLLVLFFIVVKVVSQFNDRISYPGGDEQFLWGVIAKEGLLSHIKSYYSVIVFLFLFNVLLFVPLGQKLGRLIKCFPPIRAYTINIIGSLIGVWAFFGVCFAGLSPLYWFGGGLLCVLWFIRKKRWLIPAIILGAGMLGYLAVSESKGTTVWSPYYRIDIGEVKSDDGEVLMYRLNVNRDYHQRILNLSDGFVRKHPDFYDVQPDIRYHTYNLPYRHYELKGKDVLVVGSGTGNDVAAALRHGAAHVDAVEIDRAILDLGRKLHPEKPYQSDRVTCVLDDARTYFKRCGKKYDMIVFGLLDSHTVISSMSSLRLDNYVYTLESFREVRNLLKNEKEGVVALSFSIGKKRAWIGQRLYDMLSEAFGSEPVYISTGHDAGILFIVGPEDILAKYRADEIIQAKTETARDEIQLAVAGSTIPTTTDDWPNLYLKAKKIPAAYLWTLGILLVISVIIILRFKPRGTGVNWHFLFLGVAFLLIEVKSINELALVYGATWLVTGIVISAILVMILFANLYVSRARLWPMWVYYCMLFGAIALNLLFPPASFLGATAVVRMLGPCLLAALPIFFAGIIFGKSFKKSKHTEVAFGSNLLGAVGGGMLEYVSIITGVSALFFVAAGAYGLSFLVLRKK